MHNNQLLETLKDIGLDDNEARVYLAALSLGPSTVQKIARAAEVKRTTVYSDIESLQKKGLLHIESRGFKKSYVAESPDKLENVLELRKERFKSLLPEFSALYNLKGGESFVKYYEGLPAVKNVYESLVTDIKPHEKYFVISDLEKWYALDPEYFEDFRKRRAKLNIDIRMLLLDSEMARKDVQFQKNYNMKIKLLPQTSTLVTNMIVTPQRVAIHQLAAPVMAIVIENKSIIQMQQQLFEIIWNSLPDEEAQNGYNN